MIKIGDKVVIKNNIEEYVVKEFKNNKSCIIKNEIDEIVVFIEDLELVQEKIYFTGERIKLKNNLGANDLGGKLMLNKKLQDEIKNRILEHCQIHLEYFRLYKLEYDDDVENTINKLKDDYIKCFTEPMLAFDRETLENKKHAKQSEVLSKLVMLVHQFKGFKGVQEVLHELFWKYQELVSDQLEKHEKRIAELEKE